MSLSLSGRLECGQMENDDDIEAISEDVANLLVENGFASSKGSALDMVYGSRK